MELNLAQVITSNAATFPQRDAILHGSERTTYRELTDRARRLARYLGDRELGCHTERSALQGHECGQDLMAQFLYNGAAYLEGLVGVHHQHDHLGEGTRLGAGRQI